MCRHKRKHVCNHLVAGKRSYPSRKRRKWSCLFTTRLLNQKISSYTASNVPQNSLQLTQGLCTAIFVMRSGKMLELSSAAPGSPDGAHLWTIWSTCCTRKSDRRHRQSTSHCPWACAAHAPQPLQMSTMDCQLPYCRSLMGLPTIYRSRNTACSACKPTSGSRWLG